MEEVDKIFDIDYRECPFCLDEKGEYGRVSFYHPKKEEGRPYYTQFNCTHSQTGCSIGAILFEVLNLAKKL